MKRVNREGESHFPITWADFSHQITCDLGKNPFSFGTQSRTVELCKGVKGSKVGKGTKIENEKTDFANNNVVYPRNSGVEGKGPMPTAHKLICEKWHLPSSFPK